MLLDSLSRPGVFSVMEEEIGTAYQQNQCKWTKSVVDNLKFTDNVLRESLRLSGPIVRLIREVKAVNGIQLNSVLLLKGTKIATDIHNMLRDEEIYKDANAFNPFRLNPSTGQPMPPAVETSEIFLAFGHGRVCLHNLFQSFSALFDYSISLTLCLAWLLWSLLRKPRNQIDHSNYSHEI
jgi:cytochrome P450